MTIDKEIELLKKDYDQEENVWRLSRLSKQIEHLEALKAATKRDDGKWTKHTDTYWSRDVNGKRLDYWPSTNKYRIDGSTYYGSPYKVLINEQHEKSKQMIQGKQKYADEWERSLVNQPEV